MFDLFGKAAIALIAIGLLASGVTRCSIDMQLASKFMQGVGGSMLGTSNPNIDSDGQTRAQPILIQPVQPLATPSPTP